MKIKKTVFSLLTFSMAFFTACQVVSLPSKAKDDLYIQYGSDLQKEYRIKFLETTAEEILASGYNHIYLFAEWCPGCYLHMRDIKAGSDQHDTAFITCNYNLPFMDKHFKGVDTIYILSNKAYGANEFEKIKSFIAALSGTIPAAELPQKFERKTEGFVRVEH